ncbi:AraC family transcriptional regulator [Paenibacillus sp. GCM10023250]|uniref:AraC family transcriptional regulator n=1 Tax=Paenibacillus sp. GCM10023250 TaxID=3252648 RepID=UPI00360CBB35
MNMLESFNSALDYIERNLENEIDENELAKRAHCSVYHFKRMFSYLADISLHEYIRRRRLTLAALELQNSPVKVIDVAMKYGYYSPDAFTRAFQVQHGVTPTELRISNQSLKVYPPMTFRLSIGGGEPMMFRIENKDEFQVIGITNRVTPIEMGEHPGVEQVWRSTDHDTYAELKSINNVEPFGILHVNVGEEFGNRKADYNYYLAVASTEVSPDKFSRLVIPAMTWVVVDTKVPWEPGKWKQIYGEWFPTSGYEQVEGPTIQVGPEIQIGVEKQLLTEEVGVEFWIPIKKAR